MTLTRKQAIRNLNELVSYRPQEDQSKHQFSAEDWFGGIYQECLSLQLQTASSVEVLIPEEIWRLIKDFAIGKSRKDIFKRILGNAFQFPETRFLRHTPDGHCITNDFNIIQDGQSLTPFTGIPSAGMVFVATWKYGPMDIYKVQPDLSWRKASFYDYFEQENPFGASPLNYTEGDVHYLYQKTRYVPSKKVICRTKTTDANYIKALQPGSNDNFFLFDTTKPIIYEVYRQLAEGELWREMYRQGRRP